MRLGIVLAVAAAISSGCAAVLQSLGAARIARYPGVDPRLLLSLLRSRRYVAGLALDGCSFLLSVGALRTVPLFTVQAVGAANLAVVAVLSAIALRRALPAAEWAAVAAVFAGVVMLSVSAKVHSAVRLPTSGRWSLLVAAVVIGTIALLAPGRLVGPAFPGLLAGLTYGDSAVASRVISQLGRSAPALASSPLTYAVVIAGVLGTLLYATALQRGSVTLASSMTTLGQTLAPALVGWLVLGDEFRPGLGALAVTGFVLSVGGAVVLARHAHHHHERPDP